MFPDGWWNRGNDEYVMATVCLEDSLEMAGIV